MRSIFNGEGYLLADDRASGGQRVEASMLGCSHCQKLMRKTDWKADGAFCHCCDKPICGPCSDRMLTRGCENFMRQLEQAVDDSYRQEQNAKVMGL